MKLLRCSVWKLWTSFVSTATVCC